MSYFDDVREFHRKFELPNHPAVEPQHLTNDVLEFRVKFLREELAEFVKAANEQNIYEMADALVDLVYVALGTAHMMGIPFDEHWAEVQRANMTKVRATAANDERSKRQHRFDVVKPKGFVPPDHRPIIAKAVRDWLFVSKNEDGTNRFSSSK